MKRVVKKLARSLWRISAPVRRSAICKFDNHMMSLFAAALPVHAQVPADLDLVLNSIVRELARLQIQVEVLQEQVDDLQSRGGNNALTERRLSVVPEAG
jgi:hypothetical protein